MDATSVALPRPPNFQTDPTPSWLQREARLEEQQRLRPQQPVQAPEADQGEEQQELEPQVAEQALHQAAGPVPREGSAPSSAQEDALRQMLQQLKKQGSPGGEEETEEAAQAGAAAGERQPPASAAAAAADVVEPDFVLEAGVQQPPSAQQPRGPERVEPSRCVVHSRGPVRMCCQPCAAPVLYCMCQ